MGQFPKLQRPGDEVRLAVELHHGAYPAARVDVGLDDALGGRPRALLFHPGETLRLEGLNGLLDVAFRLDEGAPAIHDAGPGDASEFLDLLGGDLHAV